MMADIRQEQERVEAEIRAAFAGVSREGGVTWSQSDVIDNWGTGQEEALARTRDTDTCWEDLVDDPNWAPDRGGSFSFLNEIGFRYYLAPVMLRIIRGGEPVADLCVHLTLQRGDLRFAHTRRAQLKLLAHFNDRQKKSVAGFLRFMVRWNIAYDTGDEYLWQAVLDSGWAEVH